MPYAQVLELAALPYVPNAYLLGTFAKRVTIYSQQTRAINLIDAIHHHRTSLKGKSVAVIGGGAAGLTAAVRALSHGATVTLFEKLPDLNQSPDLVGIQKNANHRWLHPSIYDWPFSALDSADDRAQLPVLDWSATWGNTLAKDLAGKAREIAAGSRKALVLAPPAEVTRLEAQPDGHVRLSWKDFPEQKEAQGSFDIAILAVGFGLEPFNSKEYSYWEGVPIDGTAREHSILIVGYGDGALTDLMRACIFNFEHDVVLKNVIRLVSEDKMLDVIRSIETHPRASQDPWLTENYRRLELPQVRAYLDDIRGKFRKVVLAGPGPHLLSTRASALNRVVVAQLLSLGAFHHIEFDSNVKIKGDDPKDATLARLQQQIAGLIGEPAKHVYLRFGPVPAICQVAGIERDLSELKAKWEGISVPEDPTRQRLWESPFAGISRPGQKCFLFLRDPEDPLFSVAWNAFQRLKLPDMEVVPIEVSKCFSNWGTLLHTVDALCAAPYAIFALGPEMGAKNLTCMLLLGIRSAVRRGVTVVVHDRESTASDWEKLPFDLKELQILGLGKADSGETLAASLASARTTLEGDASSYRDLPVFDIVRRTQRRTAVLEANRTEMFTLCSFSEHHEANLWRSLKRLLEGVGNLEDGSLKLQRVIDYSSPLLVADRLYELIRFAGLCLVDWSEWRSNVFFELGVRLAVHRTPPLCVIQEPDLEGLEKQPESIRQLIGFFRPIAYPVVWTQEKAGQFTRSFEAELERRKALAPPSSTIYAAASRHILPEQERGAMPAHEALWQEAARILGGDVVRSGRIPVLYGENPGIGDQALNAAIETVWAGLLLVKDQSRSPGAADEEARKLNDAADRFESLLDDLLELTQSKRFDPARAQIGAAPSTTDSSASKVTRKAEKLQRGARRARKKNELKLAATFLTSAVELLRAELDRLGGDAAGEELRSIAALLADSHGSLAGVLRRLQDDAKALTNYRAGKDLEEDDRYRITSTYNRVQWVVLSVMLNDRALQDDTKVQSTLAGTIAALKTQTVTTRRDDPWALADLGLLAALAEDQALADEAFRSMNALKPVADLYKSGKPVIERLAQVLNNPPGLKGAARWYAAGSG